MPTGVAPSFDRLTEVADSIWSLGRAGLVGGILVLLAVAVLQAWRRCRRTEIVIQPLADGTGDATAGTVVIGLTYRLREGVVSALPQLGKHVRRVVKGAQDDSTSPIRHLVVDDPARDSLVDDVDRSRRELLQSMEDVLPEKARGAYRVVATAFFQPREVHVSGVLQRRHDGFGGLGISFTVQHSGSKQETRRLTLWEDDQPKTARGETTVAQRFHDLVVPASAALACELQRQRLLVNVQEHRLRQRLAFRKGNRHVTTLPAVVEFLVGTSYASAAPFHSPATKSFYQLGDRALKRAVKDLDHYKVPFQRGHALGELARQGSDLDEGTRLLGKSTELFREAREKLPRADLPEALRRAEELKLQAALTRNACLLAEWHTDEVQYGLRVAAEAAELMRLAPADYEHPDALYNVACALAVAARVATGAGPGFDREACRRHAEGWLLHACARNQQWWRQAEVDPDLGLLRPWLPAARRRLQEAIAARSADTPLDGSAVAALIDGMATAQPADVAAP